MDDAGGDSDSESEDRGDGGNKLLEIGRSGLICVDEANDDHLAALACKSCAALRSDRACLVMRDGLVFDDSTDLPTCDDKCSDGGGGAKDDTNDAVGTDWSLS